MDTDHKFRQLVHDDVEPEPLTPEAQAEYDAFMVRQKKRWEYDEEYGPLAYRPYAGGNKFPVNETLTEKPGFKIWVDQLVIDYQTDYSYTCVEKRLDCSNTCCMQSYCAPHAGRCLDYKRRPYSEIYIGALIALMIVAGIPTCIITMGLILDLKFCRTHDQEQDTTYGGYTICEGLTHALTCGKSSAFHEPIVDDF